MRCFGTFLTILLITILPCLTHAQDPVNDLFSGGEYDSVYVDTDYSGWSVRMFTTYKYENISIRNPGAKVKYRPVDPVSAGVGVSYQTWVLDIGFRINTNTAHRTRRIDFTTSGLVGPHLLEVSFLYYKGFEEVTENYVNPFRDDIRTVTMNLDYLYFPNVKKFSYQASRTGLGFQKKNVGSPLVGGFMESHRAKGDSSLVPSANESAFDVSNTFSGLELRMVGMLFGYAQFLRLNKHLYSAAILTSGVGAYWGEKEFDQLDKDHIAGAAVQLNFYVALGYNWRRIYAIANYAWDNRFIGFGDKRRYNYNLARLKLAIGYNFLK